MKRVLIAILVGSALGSLPASAPAQTASSVQAEQPAKLAQAHAIIEVMFPPAQRDRMVEEMVRNLSAPLRNNLQTPNFSDPGLNTLVQNFLEDVFKQQRPLLQKHLPEMLDAMALAYTHEFSLGELKEIHAFAGTPAGNHYLSRSTALLGDPAVSKANSDMIADAQALSKTMVAGFKDKVIAYLKAHPDVAAKLQGENKAN